MIGFVKFCKIRNCEKRISTPLGLRSINSHRRASDSSVCSKYFNKNILVKKSAFRTSWIMCLSAFLSLLLTNKQMETQISAPRLWDGNWKKKVHYMYINQYSCKHAFVCMHEVLADQIDIYIINFWNMDRIWLLTGQSFIPKSYQMIHIVCSALLTKPIYVGYKCHDQSLVTRTNDSFPPYDQILPTLSIWIVHTIK